MKKLFVLFALLISIPAFAQTKDVVKVFEDAAVEEGTIINNAVAVFGDLDVKGAVKESAVVIGGDLKVASTGIISGDTVVILGKIIKEPGAELTGEVVELSFGKLCSGGSCHLSSIALPVVGVLGMGMIGLFGLFAVIGFLAIFLLIAIIFTDKVGRASYYAELHPWRSLYHGLIAAILVAPVTIFLIVSIIGIPIVPILFIVLSVATFFGYTLICQLIGVKFFRAIKKPGRPMVIEVIVGFVILAIVACVPVAGWFVKCAAWLTGLGATIDTRFGTRK